MVHSEKPETAAWAEKTEEERQQMRTKEETENTEWRVKSSEGS